MTRGFFTDTTLCIGCKACEVACKQWNQLPAEGYELTGMSYDNTVALGATTWRHVAFIEQLGETVDMGRRGKVSLPMLGAGGDGSNGSSAHNGSANGARAIADRARSNGGVSTETQLQARRLQGDLMGGFLTGNRWLMMSDVCKHCSNAGCLEACPTGAIIRNEFGDVYVQPDICNGCGYCQPACPFGVIEVNLDDGRAWKCTLCYDRQKDGFEPACAKACPTQSIQFGELDELHARARDRVGMLHARGIEDAYLYGVDEDTSVGSLNAFFLLVDEPGVYNLPENPHLPQAQVIPAYVATALTGLALGVAGIVTFALGVRVSGKGRGR